ncbi:hypothetical protein ACHAWF_007381 [Thalassiosira exigua]
MDKLRSTVGLFQAGLVRLQLDFRNSLRIQEAALTRLHLRRNVRRDLERRRRRLRRHETHGIRIVDGAGREVAFWPSDSYALRPERLSTSDRKSPLYDRGNYVSTRRPQRHLRQISRDLAITLPTVAAFVLVPFAGYTFLFLGMMFPRLLLSRQFHTREQRWDFATREHGEIRGWWGDSSRDFWGCCMRNVPELLLHQAAQDNIKCGEPRSLEQFSYLKMDAAGPVFGDESVRKLYRLLRCPGQSGGAESQSLSIETLQPDHLRSLALSNNLAAPLYLPSALAPTFLQTCMPLAYLRHKLKTLAEDVIMDDAALIEEGQLENACGGMTEEEVLDACWLRGLPPGRFATADGRTAGPGGEAGGEEGRRGELRAMREELTHHLQMMRAVTAATEGSSGESTDREVRPKGDLVRDASLQLLLLHLPAIRHGTNLRRER